MKILFLMDPLESINIKKDTTFALMLHAAERGHEIYYLPKGGIHLEKGNLLFQVEKVIPQVNNSSPFVRIKTEVLNEADVIFIRPDPPFDEEYLLNTWLLDHAPAQTLVINSPHGIRTVNEKLWALQFKDLIPPTLVTRDVSRLGNFLVQHYKIVIKPTDGYGGKGIFILKNGDNNAAALFETLTHDGTREILAQNYITEAENGDKRILILDGEPLGAVLRVHAKHDHRNNFMAGGKAVQTDITKQDQKITAHIKPYLTKLGLSFVGIDILGDFLIEVNVTSPTCLQEMSQLDGVSYVKKVWDFVEEKKKNG